MKSVNIASPNLNSHHAPDEEMKEMVYVIGQPPSENNIDLSKIIAETSGDLSESPTPKSVPSISIQMHHQPINYSRNPEKIPTENEYIANSCSSQEEKTLEEEKMLEEEKTSGEEQCSRMKSVDVDSTKLTKTFEFYDSPKQCLDIRTMVKRREGAHNKTQSKMNQTSNEKDDLRSRVEELESSIEKLMKIVLHEKDKGKSGDHGIKKAPVSNSVSIQTEKIKSLNDQNRGASPPSVEYRCYSPTYEQGLRREIQSRSRSRSQSRSRSNSFSNIHSNRPNTIYSESKKSNKCEKKKDEHEILKKALCEAFDEGSGSKPPLYSSEKKENTNFDSKLNKQKTSSQSLMKRRGDECKEDNFGSTNLWVLVKTYVINEMFGETDTKQSAPKMSSSMLKIEKNMEEFRQVPLKLELFLFFGIIACIDSYLYILTFLPLKFVMSAFRLFVTMIWPKTPYFKFHRRHYYQLIQVAILYIVYTTVLSPIPIGMLYHWIRGQALLKLYVLIAMCEVFDRLMCAFGQDCQDSLYWNVIIRPKTKKCFMSLLVMLIYAAAHSFLLFIHVATLSVAMNSADQALLTLLVSGNFAEIKSTVFKKYTKTNLFNIAMSDICERFKLTLFLLLIMLLNVSQGGITDEMAKNYRGMCSFVLAAELMADWIKHAFIVKLNSIPSNVYAEYESVLARDVTGIGHEGVNVNHTHAVVKRMGLAQIPLICVTARYLREVGKYAWFWLLENETMKSNSRFTYLTKSSKEFRQCNLHFLSCGLHQWILLGVIVVAMFFCLLFLKIFFGLLSQQMARRKLLDSDEENEFLDEAKSARSTGSANGKKIWAQVDTDNADSTIRKAKRQVV